MVKTGQKSIWKKFDHFVMKKIRQGLCGENFSSLAGKMAKLAFFMLQSGQKWSKVNLKNIWPLCFEKDQARGVWWNFQLASMKNGKVSIFDVAQWSKFFQIDFWPFLTIVHHQKCYLCHFHARELKFSTHTPSLIFFKKQWSNFF